MCVCVRLLFCQYMCMFVCHYVDLPSDMIVYMNWYHFIIACVYFVVYDLVTMKFMRNVNDYYTVGDYP